MNDKWTKLKTNLELMLCPPGEGVHTIHTAQDKKDYLHKLLYKTSGNLVHDKWIESLDKLPQSTNISLLGICSDTGGGIQRGANWGPLFIREYLQKYNLGLKYFDMGDVKVIPHLLHDKYLTEKTITNCQKALYKEKVNLPVSPLSIAEKVTKDFYQTFPKKGLLCLGGDHSVSYPIVKEFLLAKKAQGKTVAIIHFDAHTDLLIERLGIDLCFGSWVPHILPFISSPDLVFQVGIRSSGKDKSHWESKFGVKQFWSSEIKKDGAISIARKILSDLKQKCVDELYISVDVDVLDEKYAGATGTPEPEGLDPAEVAIIINQLSAEIKVVSADFVEVAPNVIQKSIPGCPEPETTLYSSLAIITSLIQALNLNNGN